jgi:DNA-binding CsgD family transcriptional regulator
MASRVLGVASERGCEQQPEYAPRILSNREIGILRCLMRGEANKVIARQFDISEATKTAALLDDMNRSPAGRARVVQPTVTCRLNEAAASSTHPGIAKLSLPRRFERVQASAGRREVAAVRSLAPVKRW